jgi:IS4 transposase
MDKSNYFFGQSVLGQLISFLPTTLIEEVVKQKQSDYYYKRFKTRDHLISMLFSVLSNCSSLREVAGAMLGLCGKTKHFQLKHIPRKSTLSDANRKRSNEVFAKIYQKLLAHYKPILSDSRQNYVWMTRIDIIDSTTISLFKDILKCVGRNPISGKRKGGIKVHTLMNMQEQVPRLVWFSSATTHDHEFIKHFKLNKNRIAVFDKGYNDYALFSTLCENDNFFVTRLKENASFTAVSESDIPNETDTGVLKDEVIQLQVKEKNVVIKTITLRRIAYWDNQHKRCFEFLTNLFDMDAGHIALIYKQRWKIELLYKQLKQNFPLKYFLGDNENAIKIQIWCTLIANLLLTVIRKKLKRKWAFSNLVSFCRLHLFNYIHLLKFLENPEKDWRKTIGKQSELLLFD